jgi:hypothetical protein
MGPRTSRLFVPHRWRVVKGQSSSPQRVERTAILEYTVADHRERARVRKVQRNVENWAEAGGYQDNISPVVSSGALDL